MSNSSTPETGLKSSESPAEKEALPVGLSSDKSSTDKPGADKPPAEKPADQPAASGSEPIGAHPNGKAETPVVAAAAPAKASDSAAVEAAPKTEGKTEGGPAGKGEDQPETKAEATPEPAPTSSAGAEPPKRAGEVKLRLFGRTDVGQVREHNEDNFIVADLTKESRGLMESDRTQLVGDRGTLLGVCDGMGGAAAGEVASQLAVDIIYQRMAIGDPPKDHDELAARLVHAIEAAGLRIFSEAKLDRTRRGMGTTSTIAALVDDHLFLGQVGDSRGYILRGDRLVQVTRDQSLVNQLIEAGQLTEEEAETFEHNNIILQALGTADTVQVDLTYVHLRYGDTLMLCSDGLSGMVRNDEIREVLRAVDDPLEACKTLTDRANQSGGHDNITVVVAKFEGTLPPPTRDDIDGLRYQKYQLPEPPPASNATLPEPSRKVKDLHQAKVSSRPPAHGPHGPEVETSETTGDEIYGEEEGADGRPLYRSSEDPIQIPTEGAPQWLVVMMILSAVASVTIAGWYLLR